MKAVLNKLCQQMSSSIDVFMSEVRLCAVCQGYLRVRLAGCMLSLSSFLFITLSPLRVHPLLSHLMTPPFSLLHLLCSFLPSLTSVLLILPHRLYFVFFFFYLSFSFSSPWLSYHLANPRGDSERWIYSNAGW